MSNARTAFVLAASLAGAALACTHVYGKKVLAVSITSSGGAAALREAIARQVDALYGALDYDVSYEEVLITGSVNRVPLAFPIIKLCDQTYAEAVRQTPISIVPVSGGGSGGASAALGAPLLVSVGSRSTDIRACALMAFAESKPTSSAGARRSPISRRNHRYAPTNRGDCLRGGLFFGWQTFLGFVGKTCGN